MVAMTVEPTQLTRVAYSAKETAELLGVSPVSIYTAVNRGDIRAVRIGGRIVVPAEELRRLLDLDDGGSAADGGAPCPED